MTDRCAACFSVLAPGPLGSRLACNCTPPNNWRHLRGSYLSEAVPPIPHTPTAVMKSKHGKPDLHFYGAPKP